MQENSPGHRAGLEAYFDYIVSIEGVRLVGNDPQCVLILYVTLQNTDNDVLKETLKKKMDQGVQLVVYNSKSRTCRGNDRHLLVLLVVVVCTKLLMLVGWE